MDPLQLLPEQRAQQKTQDYFGGPWYKRLLTGLSEGLKSQGKDYETPYDKFFKQSLTQYQAETPRLGAEMRAQTAENLLKNKQDEFQKTLTQKEEFFRDKLALEEQKLRLKGIKDLADIDLTKARTEMLRLNQGLTGNAAMEARALKDPEGFGKEWKQLQDIRKATDEYLEAKGKIAGTPDIAPRPGRTQVIQGTNEFGIPTTSNINVPGVPGISRAAERSGAEKSLLDIIQPNRNAAPQNALTQPFSQLGQQPSATQPAPAIAAPATSATPTPAAPSVPDKAPAMAPVSQEDIRSGKATASLPPLTLPGEMLPGALPFKIGELKGYTDKKAVLQTTEQAASLAINLFIKDELKEISGPIMGSELGKRLRSMGFIDPKTSQFALDNTFMDQWKKKMYSETGMQANQVEMGTAQSYFGNLGNSPEANLKKAIYMALAQRFLIESRKLPGVVRNGIVVDPSYDLITKTDRIVDGLKKGFAFDPRDFNMTSLVHNKYQVKTQQQGPKVPLNQRLGVK